MCGRFAQAGRPRHMTESSRSNAAGQPAADASSTRPEAGYGFRVVCFLRVPHTAQAARHTPVRL